MGLLDRFKKKEEPKATTRIVSADSQRMDSGEAVKEFVGKDGKTYVEIEYYNENADFKDFYDTTRLIVRKDPTILPSGKMVYDARVSWYGESDAVRFDEYGKDMNRRNQMTAIRLGIDFAKLRTDEDYKTVVMTQLLKKKRIEKYMEQGLQDNPEQPCGNYIGYVGMVIDRKTGQQKNGKRFDENIGREIHYLPEQTELREKHKQAREQERQADIQNRQRRIQQLQAEINDLSK